MRHPTQNATLFNCVWQMQLFFVAFYTMRRFTPGAKLHYAQVKKFHKPLDNSLSACYNILNQNYGRVFMNKRFLITVVLLGVLAMLAVWILAVHLFISPQYRAACDAGLESVAEIILILQLSVSFIIGHCCAKFCTKAIGAIYKRGN